MILSSFTHELKISATGDIYDLVDTLREIAEWLENGGDGAYLTTVKKQFGEVAELEIEVIQ